MCDTSRPAVLRVARVTCYEVARCPRGAVQRVARACFTRDLYGAQRVRECGGPWPCTQGAQHDTKQPLSIVRPAAAPRAPFQGDDGKLFTLAAALQASKLPPAGDPAQCDPVCTSVITLRIA